MVVVSATDVNKICKLFTHNPLIQDQGNPTLLSIMGIHKECIANVSEFKSEFREVKHVYVCVAMGNQQHLLHSNIAFIHPRKPGRTPT